MYRHNAHVVNVFISSATAVADAAPSFATYRGYATARWVNGGLAYRAVGDIAPEDMRALVALVAAG